MGGLLDFWMAEVKAPFELGVPEMRDELPKDHQCEEPSSSQREDQVDDESPDD